MTYLRNRIVTKLACIAVIMCISLVIQSIWLGKTRSTDLDSLVPRFQATKLLTEENIYPVQKPFDCEKLFNGDDIEMKRAVAYLRNKNKTQHFYKSLNSMPLSCQEYKDSRGYIMKQSLKIEEELPIAFNILFHKGFEQFERLVRALYRPQHQFCIHIDKKTPVDIFETIEALADCFENIFIASKLEIVVYEGYARLVADVNCMRDHIDRNYKWKYLINMAASEFPIMSNLQIVQILTEFDGVNDIEEVFIHKNQDRYIKRHFTYIYPGTYNGRMIHTKERKHNPPHGLTITKGNAYGVFSRAFVEFILSDNISRDLLAWLEDTSVSEEHYWPTLNNLHSNRFLKSPGGFKGHPKNKPYFARFIRWNKTEHEGQCKDRHYVHNICVFSVQDLPLIKERHEIIANKFDIEYDPIVYDCMEEWIHNKTISQNGITDLSVYRQSLNKDTFIFRDNL